MTNERRVSHTTLGLQDLLSELFAQAAHRSQDQQHKSGWQLEVLRSFTSPFTMQTKLPLSIPVTSAASQARAAVQPASSCKPLCRRRETRERSAAAHGYAYAEASTDSATVNSDADDYYSILGVVCCPFTLLPVAPAHLRPEQWLRDVAIVCV